MDFKDKELEAKRGYEKHYWRIGANVAARLGITLKQLLSKNEEPNKTNEWLSKMKNKSYLFTDEFQGEMTGKSSGAVCHKISNHRKRYGDN